LISLPFIEINYFDIAFDENVQNLCVNSKYSCPNYSHCWACPPNSPFMKNKLAQHEKFFLVYYKYDLHNFSEKMRERHSNWSDKMCRNPRYYNNSIRKGLELEINQFLLTYKEKYQSRLILGGGSCRICKTQKYHGCSFDLNEPCRFPEKRRYSMEAVGINVDETVKQFGIHLEWPPINWVYQIGLICFK